MELFEEKGTTDIDQVHARKKASKKAKLNCKERKNNEQSKSNITGPCGRQEK